MKIKQSFRICFGIALVLITVGTASADTITVNNSTGPVADFTSIQAAVDAVTTTDGDTIVVYPGIYTENVDVYKELTIISQSGNIEDTIVHAADPNYDVFYVTADGANISFFTLSDARSPEGNVVAGIYLYGVQNNVISNNKLSNNHDGIRMYDSSNNTVRNNNASNNTRGINLESSYNNLLKYNNVSNNNYCGMSLSASSNNDLNNNTANSNDAHGIYLSHTSNNNMLNNNTALNNYMDGIFFSESANNTLNRNNVSSNDNYGIRFILSSINNVLSNNTVKFNIVGIALQDSFNNTLVNNTADSNTGNGIALYKGSNNTLTNNTASNNFNGIYLYGVDGSKLSNNNASKNKDFGINVLYSNNGNKICNNTANSNGRYGISFYDSSNNTLSNNVISYNEIGIRLRVNLGTTSDNEIKSNIVLNNEQGIYISNSSSNLIYNNYFNNTDNVVFFGYDVGNIWNITKIESTNIVDGPYLGGNYWATPDNDGFSQINVDTNWDGICDDAYVIDSDNIDYLPLAEYDYIQATIEIIPDTLTLKNKPGSITAYIELPEGYSVKDIDVGSLTLNNNILFDSPIYATGRSKIGDYDRDGTPDLKVKFDANTLNPVPSGVYACTIAGELSSSQTFVGIDNIYLITKVKPQK